jgi:plasmid stabilization system protein ParE
MNGFTVMVSEEARAELEQAYEWLVTQTPQHAPEWNNALIDALISLETNPSRCPVLQTDDETGEEYRQLLFGDKRHAYRIIFVIRGKKVWIGHIVHAARAR